LSERPEDREREQALAAEALHQARAEQRRDDDRRIERPRTVARPEPPEHGEERQDERAAGAVDEALEALRRREKQRNGADVGDDGRGQEPEPAPGDRDEHAPDEESQSDRERVPPDQLP